MKKNVAFTLISFAVLKWDKCLSVQLPFQLPFEIPFQLHLELKRNLLDQGVNELEFELSSVDVQTQGKQQEFPVQGNEKMVFK